MGHLIPIICIHLQRHEDQDLSYQDAEEHGERIDRRVGHGGLVVTADAVGVGQCRGVGGGTTDHACNGEVTAVEHYARHNTDDDAGQERNDETIEHPPIATIHHGIDKTDTGTQSDRCHEERDTNLAHQQFGRRRGIGDDAELRTIAREQDRYNKWTACQAQLDRYRHAREEDWQRT